MQFISFLVIAYVIWKIFKKVNHIGSKTSMETASTFQYKNLAVYADEGVFVFDGVKRNISDVRRVEFEEYGAAGCLGGRKMKIHIIINDVKKPRVTIHGMGLSYFGNDKFKDQYERISIVLGCG